MCGTTQNFLKRFLPQLPAQPEAQQTQRQTGPQAGAGPGGEQKARLSDYRPDLTKKTGSTAQIGKVLEVWSARD
jgi:hypothetical protein